MSRFVIISAARRLTLQASLAVTEAGDSLSADATLGAVSRIADAAITEAGDTCSAGATLTVGATLAKAEAADTCTAAAVVAIAGGLSKTEAADTLAGAAGVALAAGGQITEQGDTATSGAAVVIGASGAATEASDTLTGAGAAVVAASLAITEAADTLAATGALESGSRTAVAEIAEAGDTLQAAGAVLVLGVLQVGEGADGLSASAGRAGSAAGGAWRGARASAGAGGARARGKHPVVCASRCRPARADTTRHPMGIKIITPPTLIADTGGIATAANLRTHLRIAADGSEDGLMTSYFAAAHKTAEHYTGRPIGLQTLELALDEFPAGDIELGQVVKDITSLKYIDEAGVEQTVSSANYTLDDYSCPCWLIQAVGFDWPATSDVVNAVKVRFRAGEVVPGPVLSALLLMTGWLFENAGDDARVTDDIQPPAAKSLLNTVKVWGF